MFSSTTAELVAPAADGLIVGECCERREATQQAQLAHCRWMPDVYGIALFGQEAGTK